MSNPEQILQTFILPLVSGGKVHVGRPLDASDLAALQDEASLQGELVVAVEGAMGRRAADLWLTEVDTALDPWALRLVAAAHNLLFLSHPGAERWTVRSRTREQVEAFIISCLDMPRPIDEEQLVARHVLLENLIWLSREDVEVRFWLGRRQFQGTSPPPGLLRWQRLRRVRQTHATVNWLGTDLSPAQVHSLGLLLRQSPLTDLLSPHRGAPAFRWQPVLGPLASPAICRLACHQYAEMGLSVVGPPLARAFWDLVGRAGKMQHHRRALVVVSGLVLYLLATASMSGPADAPPPELRRSDDLPQESLGSVLVAAARCGLMPPQEALPDREIQSKLGQWLSAYRDRLGENGDALAARLQEVIGQ